MDLICKVQFEYGIAADSGGHHWHAGGAGAGNAGCGQGDYLLILVVAYWLGIVMRGGVSNQFVGWSGDAFHLFEKFALHTPDCGNQVAKAWGTLVLEVKILTRQIDRAFVI